MNHQLIAFACIVSFSSTYGMDNALVQSHATALTKDAHAQALVELLQIDANRSEELKKIHLRMLKQEEEKTSLQAQLRATKDELANQKTNNQNLADQMTLLQESNIRLEIKVDSLKRDKSELRFYVTGAIFIGGLAVLSHIIKLPQTNSSVEEIIKSKPVQADDKKSDPADIDYADLVHGLL